MENLYLEDGTKRIGRVDWSAAIHKKQNWIIRILNKGYPDWKTQWNCAESQSIGKTGGIIYESSKLWHGNGYVKRWNNIFT